MRFLVAFLFLPFLSYGFSTIDSLQSIVTSIDSLEEYQQYIHTSIELGNALLDEARYEEATTHFNKASSLAFRYNLSEDHYLADLRLARTYERQGKFKQLADLTEKMLKKIPNKDLSKRGEILRIFATSNIYQGIFEVAYKSQMEALDIYITLKDSIGLQKVYFGLGNTFFYQHQSELSKKNFQKSLDISRRLHLTMEIADCLNALGSIASEEGDFDTALLMSEQALEIFNEKEDKVSIAWTIYNIGTILHDLGRIDEGLDRLKECKMLCDEINEVALQGYVLNSMGAIYTEKKEFDKAIKCFNESFQIAIEDNDQSSIIELLEEFAEVYYQKKDLEMYKSYQDKFSALKDSIYSQDLLTSISDLKKDFEIKQLHKENEIQNLKSEKQLQALSFKNRFWIGIAIMILFISFGLLMFTRQRNAKERNTLLQNKNKEIERQVELLKVANRDLVKYTEIVSHDLREPLRNLSGFAYLLKRELKDYNISESAKEYMDFIKTGANQMGGTLEGISKYSKLYTETKSKETINLNGLVKDVIKKLEPLINDTNAQIEISELPEINFNRDHIHQVFYNLLKNALNFRSDRTPLIKINCQKQNGDYLFSVSDNGAGIPEKFHKKIFVVFQRLQDRKTYTGAGLGLSTCKKILELNKGEIFLESEEGKGTIFFFKIPQTSIGKSKIMEASLVEG